MARKQETDFGTAWKKLRAYCSYIDDLRDNRARPESDLPEDVTVIDTEAAKREHQPDYNVLRDAFFDSVESHLDYHKVSEGESLSLFQYALAFGHTEISVNILENYSSANDCSAEYWNECWDWAYNAYHNSNGENDEELNELVVRLKRMTEISARQASIHRAQLKIK